MSAQIIPFRLDFAVHRPSVPSPEEMISAAAQMSMADKVQRWAQSFIDDLDRFNRPLNAPQCRDLLKVLAVIEKHPEPS